ncbi:hypothetical protein [Cupriavidus sp. UME77]|uniref:hypothetical protein n=1 Tax=Cupriavidus sp. UME77 TaxID=1862321 RepID=UPI0016033DA8|nr:hypothetical protein [Cupriavidus sp. UME77]MBB1634940.1 hypothetical protein [Cupriavidus sp. UME77]
MAEAIQAETEDWELVSKGVCIVGAPDSIRHILLLVHDGKVFIVDSIDNREVDAWFTDLTTMIDMLNLG